MARKKTIEAIETEISKVKSDMSKLMWRMTTMPSFQSGYGNVYSLK